MTQELAQLVADLVGKPFAWGGRGPASYDCWGLVREALERMGARGVPDYPSSLNPAHRGDLIREVAQTLPIARLELPRAGAIVLFRDQFGIGSHVGIMVDADRFLHTSEQLGFAAIERLSNPVHGCAVMALYGWAQPVACDPEISV